MENLTEWSNLNTYGNVVTKKNKKMIMKYEFSDNRKNSPKKKHLDPVLTVCYCIILHSKK
jgi:hypothetical protein